MPRPSRFSLSSALALFWIEFVSCQSCAGASDPYCGAGVASNSAPAKFGSAGRTGIAIGISALVACIFLFWAYINRSTRKAAQAASPAATQALARTIPELPYRPDYGVMVQSAGGTQAPTLPAYESVAAPLPVYHAPNQRSPVLPPYPSQQDQTTSTHRLRDKLFFAHRRASKEFAVAV